MTVMPVQNSGNGKPLHKIPRLVLVLILALLVSGCTAAPTSSPLVPTAQPSPARTPLPTLTPPAVAASATARAAPLVSSPTSGAAKANDPPPPCAGANMVYHQGLGRIVLLDCYVRNATATPTRIWGWNGQRWDLLEETGPPGRDLGGAAYDSRRQRLIIYGGLYLGLPDCSRETWEWAGRGWTKVEATSPGPCNHFKMTYDAAHGATVLFGGQNEQQRPLAETWTWDGTAWREAPPTGGGTAAHPPSRAHFGFVYDQHHEQILLYGGYDSGMYRDLWSWNGTTWHELQGAGPGPRSHLGMALDEGADALVIFGGAKTSSTFNSLGDETWILTGGTWAQAGGAAPSARGLPAMAYDPERKKILLYGGFNATEDFADTWEWNGSGWTCLAQCL